VMNKEEILAEVEEARDQLKGSCPLAVDAVMVQLYEENLNLQQQLKDADKSIDILLKLYNKHLKPMGIKFNRKDM